MRGLQTNAAEYRGNALRLESLSLVVVGCRVEPVVPVRRSSGEEDGRSGVLLPEVLDQRDGAAVDRVCVHVGQAVDDKESGVKLRQELCYRLLHHAVPSKAVVENHPLEKS